MKFADGALAFLVRCIVVGLAAAFVIGQVWPDLGQRLRARLHPADAPAASVAPAPASTAPPTLPAPASYADAVARAAPAVVNIYANRVVTMQVVPMYSAPILQQMLGATPIGTVQRPIQNLGSGVIVSPQGYVLTNNHVIAKASDIQVLLYDGRVAKATLVGADPETDLAVLKIDAGNLPVIPLARRPPRVGDIALAIGNPLGLNQTVTLGIVSALGRQLGTANPEGFIQTDAAINPGNSGGALVNANGGLIGINTLLIGRNANAEGIGFAIPADTAEDVLKQIIATGHVVRGWIGADYGFVPVAADSGLPAAARGAQINEIYPGGPAAQAGLQVHDIVLQVGQVQIDTPSDLRRFEASLKPGSKVEVSGLRNGATFHTTLTVGQQPPSSVSGAAGSDNAGISGGVN